jgi:hypothetical protein
MGKDSARAAQWTLSVSVIKTNQVRLYREIIALCSEIHTKHINTLCGQNIEFVNVKPAALYYNIASSFLNTASPSLPKDNPHG